MAANCLLIVTAEVDASVEDEWNKWYNEVHLPDALACPGVLSGKRYCAVGDVSFSDRGSRLAAPVKLYTTVYELNGPEAVRTPEFLKMRGWAHLAPHVRSQTRVVTAL